MKENKECFVRTRLTKSEKELVEKFCAENHISVSNLVRVALKQYMKEEK